MFETKLSSVLLDPKKASYITPSQITLNYCEISSLDKVPSRFHCISKLFLSHNKISTLSGIEQFQNLTHFSIGYNQIEDHRELHRIPNKESLKSLMIQGNPLETHPNHKVLLLEMFPNLEKLNNLKVDQNLRELLEKKTSTLQRNLITFLYHLYDEINNMEILLSKLKISLELSSFKNNDPNKSAQEKLTQFMDSHKKLNKFKNLFDFQRVEQLKSFLNARRFSSKIDFLSILLNLSEIVTSLYGPFDNKIINNRQAFFTIYKCLYMELIEKLNKRLDKNLEHFLVKKVMENDFINHQRFSEDDEYALDCMLAAFYTLLPTQASIGDIICYDRTNRMLEPTPEYFRANGQFNENGFCNLSPDNLSNRIYKWQHSKDIWKYKRNEVSNDLEINEKNPEIIKNVLLVHFPVFPLNKNFMESLLEIINSKFQLFLSFYSQTLKLLNGNPDLKPPRMKIPNEKSIRNQLENEFLESSLDKLGLNTVENQQKDTLRMNENSKSNENRRKSLKDEANNTETLWNNASTMKIKNLEQNNQVFSFSKESQRENSKERSNSLKRKPGTLKKSVLKRKNQETNTNIDLEKIENEKKKKKQTNMLKLCSKIINERAKKQLKMGFELIKRHFKEKKRELKEIMEKKKKSLEKFNSLSRKFIEKINENNKKKTLLSMKKLAFQTEKNEILKKYRLRKIFNILYENLAENRRKIQKFYEKMLKCKVFFSMLRGLCNKKKAQKSLQSLINFYRAKRLRSGLSKWKGFLSDKRSKSLNKTDNLGEFCNSYFEKLKNQLKDENFNSSNSRTDNFKSYKDLLSSKNNKKPLGCNCKHYFRRCGACEAFNFN